MALRLGSAAEPARSSLPQVTIIDEHGRPEPPLAADEVASLVGFLEWQRATFAWKCEGLDRSGLVVTVGPSTMTLGGLLKHLALVEDYWFSEQLHGRQVAPWDAVDWAADRDWEWHSAAAERPEELRAMWETSVGRSRAALEEILATDGLDGLVRRPPEGREAASVRWVLLHMIEEYARHNGHADLLREAVDGATGE
jgi:uncharacterized damage-inducible protein DinB